MYVSTMETFVFEPEKFLSTSELVWHIPPQSLGQRYPRFSQRLRLPLPESVRTTNGTGLYAFLFVQNAATFTPDPDFNDKYSVFARAPLVSIRQREIDRKHLLLGKDKEAENHKDVAADRENEPWVPHAKTRLQWEIVLEDNTFYDWRMPLDLVPFMRVQKNVSSKHHPYAPLAWENPLAVYAKHWVPLTNQSAVSESTPLDAEFIDVDVSLAGVVLGWFRLCNYASQGMKELTSSRSLIHYTETDVDNLKEMVYEVNPLMLAITLAAMALHLLFEFLAYKEDVAFWSNKSKDSIQGISRSSMLMGLASSWLSFLYMWDRRKETSVVVIAGAAVGAVVEAWKVTKVFSARDIFSAIKGKPVSDTNRQHAQQSPQDKDTSEAAKRGQVQREVDQQTAWYMVRVCIPVMAAYATYSLLYQKHESYVSWFLNISLITVYSLEFVQMWPQLLINHKLKTVDMLPLTAFLYRFLRTFIDDLFALVVPMPLVERIGTLRDDVVFVVLCYQWFRFPRRKSPPEHSVNDKDNDKEKKKKTE
ncbi:Cleft lip and palate associated transmembrane protein 1 [Coemansia sp. RSA 2599]|nr:Cleft lip and palate associated transmembrane protein 1 [Coemansia sp. RSA 2599]